MWAEGIGITRPARSIHKRTRDESTRSWSRSTTSRPRSGRRARRKEQGRANLQYIRFGWYFVILATEGEHIFKRRERSKIRDVRRNSIRFGGYQVSFRNGHVQVRIDDETYNLLRAYYVDLATRRNKDFMISEFYQFPFEPYAPIRRQAFNILRQVNRVRKVAGYETIPASAIWLKRKIVRPFEEETTRVH